LSLISGQAHQRTDLLLPYRCWYAPRPE